MRVRVPSCEVEVGRDRSDVGERIRTPGGRFRRPIQVERHLGGPGLGHLIVIAWGTTSEAHRIVLARLERDKGDVAQAKQRTGPKDGRIRGDGHGQRRSCLEVDWGVTDVLERDREVDIGHAIVIHSGAVLAHRCLDRVHLQLADRGISE